MGRVSKQTTSEHDCEMSLTVWSLPSVFLRWPLRFPHFRAQLGDVPYGLLTSEGTFVPLFAQTAPPWIHVAQLTRSFWIWAISVYATVIAKPFRNNIFLTKLFCESGLEVTSTSIIASASSVRTSQVSQGQEFKWDHIEVYTCVRARVNEHACAEARCGNVGIEIS
jgi:hypothetical protein